MAGRFNDASLGGSSETVMTLLVRSTARGVFPWALALALLPSDGVSARTIDFSGRTWTVRSVFGGPGPNEWSDDPQSVWVDVDGRLHLKIRQIAGVWKCAEVVSDESLGYGSYRFQLGSDTTVFDPRVVVGLFTYLDDFHEIDIEMSRWADAQNDDGQFVVQPYDAPGHIERFPIALTDSYSTHWFQWRQDFVRFESARGLHDLPAPASDLIHTWTFAGGGIPIDDAEKVHINLWLFQGIPPINGQEVELIIERFTYTPLIAEIPAMGTGAAAVLALLAIIVGSWVIVRRLKREVIGVSRGSAGFRA